MLHFDDQEERGIDCGQSESWGSHRTTNPGKSDVV